MSKAYALVTGASSGIGLEIARSLALEGYNLILSARGTAKLETLAREIQVLKVKCEVISADLSSTEGAKKLFQDCQEKQLDVEILVNNAGLGGYGNFADRELSEELNMIQVNVVSLTALSNLFVKEMVKKGRGRILNVASTAAFQPGPLMAVYFATKAFVLSLSEAMAEELDGTGVSVTALCPGATQSGFATTANMNDSRLFKGRTLPSSQEVAEAGVHALLKGQRVFVHGVLNRVLVESVRITPRRLITKIVKNIQKHV